MQLKTGNAWCDRRRAQRHRVLDVRADCSGAGAAARCRVVDLSLTGARLHGGLRVPRGARLKLELRVMGSAASTSAVVARVGDDPEAVGIKFSEMSEGCEALVRNVLDTEWTREHRPTVLVAADPRRSERLRDELVSSGCRAVVATTVLDAMFAIWNRSEPITTVAIDADAAAFDPYDLAAFVAATYQKLRCVIVSLRTYPLHPSRAVLNELADSCFSASSAPALVRTAFRDEIRRSRSVSPG